MATMVPPQKGSEYIFYVSLVSQADIKLMQSNPTLASGDVTVTTDGNAVTNLDTLPDVDPDASYFVKVTVSATEMNGDNIAILFHDAADDEWCDLMINIQTAGQSLDAMDTNIDDIESELTDIHDTDLPAVKTVVDNIETDTQDLQGNVDTMHDTDLPAVKTVVDAIQTITDAIPDAGALTALLAYVDCLPASLGDIVESTSAALVDAVWDEEITGAAHNAATVAGRRLRQAADVLIAREETCQAGGGNAEVILDASASGSDDFYNNGIIVLISGTGAGQSRHIDDYDQATKTCTVNRDWETNPDATTGYVIRFDSTKHIHGLLAAALAEINAEVVDALGTDTLSELSQGIPAATPTIKAALMLLYMIARNKLTTTASELGVYNDAGTKIAKKALSDDGTVYTEGEMESGA